MKKPWSSRLPEGCSRQRKIQALQLEKAGGGARGLEGGWRALKRKETGCNT